MFPVLRDGDYVIASRLKSLRVGRLAVVRHPVYNVLIKRVIKINQQGEFFLEGENINSLSCEQMGCFTLSQLLGVVFFCIKQG